MDNKSKAVISGIGASIAFEVFAVDKNYNILQLITNKQHKYDVNIASPSDFPVFCHKIKILSVINFYNKAIVLWFAVGFWISFLITIGLFANSYQAYLSALGIIWGLGAVTFFLTFIIIPVLFLIPFLSFHSFNKKYLSTLKSLFKKMQAEGYIEKDLNKYPESLQMAFWEYHWYDWHQDLSHYLHHWVWWYGFLALKYFFYEYDKLVFPDWQIKIVKWLLSKFCRFR